MSREIPIIAILAPNALMGIGLRSILERMIPYAVFKVCDNFEQIEQIPLEELFHMFVSAHIFLEHRDFFEARHNKTILLTNGTPLAQHLDNYKQINIAASQQQIEESFKSLHAAAHGAQPRVEKVENREDILSPREIEVLRLVVEGKINKEIAEQLNIALATVISHRKNIVEKLGIRSVAGLTIYAVMKRLIEI